MESQSFQWDDTSPPGNFKKDFRRRRYIFTYHLTALAVSFAVFGLGAGAYARVRWLSSLPQRALAVVAQLAASVSLLALYVGLMLTHEMAVIVCLSAVPFVFAGVAVSHYYEVRRAERVARPTRSTCRVRPRRAWPPSCS